MGHGAWRRGLDGMERSLKMVCERTPTEHPRGGSVKLPVLVMTIVLLLPVPAAAQAKAVRAPIGTWKFDLKQGPKKEGPRTVIVRQDSSASYGTQTVRWRMVGDSLALALGGEWVNYSLKLKGKRLTLAGGDLNDPVTFDLIGPPSPRPDSVSVPADPDR
jgi:hypothetical protein